MGKHFRIPVSILEFHEGQTTLWVHGPEGATVLRIKAKKINVQKDCENVCAHSDIQVDGEITICIPSKPTNATTERKRRGSQNRNTRS
jgi:hypothetical protein